MPPHWRRPGAGAANREEDQILRKPPYFAVCTKVPEIEQSITNRQAEIASLNLEPRSCRLRTAPDETRARTGIVTLNSMR
jgi:hypothetical protein